MIDFGCIFLVAAIRNIWGALLFGRLFHFLGVGVAGYLEVCFVDDCTIYL
jgi:uncharacterized membrane protein YedE/YeeE